MTERTEQRGDPEVGVCHVCGKEFPTQGCPVPAPDGRTRRRCSARSTRRDIGVTHMLAVDTLLTGFSAV